MQWSAWHFQCTLHYIGVLLLDLSFKILWVSYNIRAKYLLAEYTVILTMRFNDNTTLCYSNYNPLSIYCTWFWNSPGFMNWIFSLFQTWILQATTGRKIQFRLEKNSSSSNLIFQTGELQKSSSSWIQTELI